MCKRTAKLPLKIINEADIDVELQKLAASAFSPVVKKWLKTTVKGHILSLDGMDRNENFVIYDAANVRDLHGDPPPYDKLPDWAKAALARGETLHWFDPIQVYRREAWQAVKTITLWLNSFPRTLTFADAAKQAEAWINKVNATPEPPEEHPEDVDPEAIKQVIMGIPDKKDAETQQQAANPPEPLPP